MKKYKKPISIIWDKSNYYAEKICPRCELVRFRAENFVKFRRSCFAILCTRLFDVYFRGCPLGIDDKLYLDYVRQKSDFYNHDLPW